jgi:hypothetical protein
MGTNDFTIQWRGILPDYTPAANAILFVKASGGQSLSFSVRTTGTLRLFLNGVEYVSTVGASLTDGQGYNLAVSVIRESASVAGSITFYVNGVQIGAAVAIPAGAPGTVTNSASAYTAGTDTTRTAGSLQTSRLFNRALTAAEVLDLSINGVALADRGASQTAVYTSDFSAGVDGWTVGTGRTITGNNDGIDGEDNWAALSNPTTGLTLSTTKAGSFLANKNYRRQIKVHNPSGSLITHVGVLLTETGTFVSGLQVVQYKAVPAGSTVLFDISGIVTNTTTAPFICATNSSGVVVNVATVETIYFKDVTHTQIGLTSELLASNAQSDTGQIFDSSGNKNHALLPASGATVVGRPVSQTREVRWTNTWAGTNELQYIGGVNQAIIPANAYIESIIGTVSGATPHDIIVGNGSDTDRYVTITTGLAAGTTSFTLANRTTDGTNLKLTVDVDTDATMSIAWVIRFSTLEA